MKKLKQRIKESNDFNIPNEQKIELLIKMKKECGMNTDKNYVKGLDEFELKSQLKHYKKILSTSLGI